MPDAFACRVSAAATSRTWLGPPAMPSLPELATVLHGVDDHKRRLDLGDVAEHRGEVGFAGEKQMLGESTRALGAQSHLVQRLFSADVEHLLAGLGNAAGELEQQRRLADAGLARAQHDSTRNDAAAEHAIELVDAGCAARCIGCRHLGDRHCAGGCAGCHGDDGSLAEGARADLFDGAPGLALVAPTNPFGASPAALDTTIGGLCFCHASNATGHR